MNKGILKGIAIFVVGFFLIVTGFWLLGVLAELNVQNRFLEIALFFLNILMLLGGVMTMLNGAFLFSFPPETSCVEKK